MKTYAVVGLGYVGLGLAVALGRHHPVLGYDINHQRIKELQQHLDTNQQVSTDDLLGVDVTFTHKLDDIKAANFYIIAVSTPAYFYETPNLEPLIKATEQIASIIKPGDILVFESTVYPGTTEKICVPILENVSKLSCGKDFNVGYSPERINPGDTTHTLKTINKIISAQNKPTLESIQETYHLICDKVHPVSSIAAAEAVKLLENTQRDVNIALLNEFTKIMHALNLNTHEIIEAAKTKWCFLPFKPGFVGGHCISIDPHYLALVAKRHGVLPELILAARRINDGMTQFVIQSMTKLLIKNNVSTMNATIGIFGVSYKENLVDLRNSLSLKLVKELKEYGFKVRVHDPLRPLNEIVPTDIKLDRFEDMKGISVAIIAVGHDFYQDKLDEILTRCTKPNLLMDIPNLFIDALSRPHDLIYWSL